ncbi:MAG TPA: response regulator transcription factor [Terriglobia bacterium]|nr:response regulator transcription factor [Terriglobia bacterium]
MQRRKIANSKHKTKILIADSEAVFRVGLKKVFGLEDDLRVVAQAENSLQLVAMARSFRPDLAVVQQEIVLNGHNDLVERIQHESPACRVVLTAAHLSAGEIDNLLRSGVSGVVPRSAQPEEFVESVRRVVRGETVRPLRLENTEKATVADYADQKSRPVDTLTPREKTIISCLTQGWRNRDIAQHLTITEQTVKNHLRSIYDKVGVSDRLELALYAIHQRLDLPPVVSCS